MHRILFICRGNICRSTMAQFVMEDLVRRAGRGAEFTIDSAATSTEELGNPPHPGTVRVLNRAGVPVGEHRARQVRRAEYDDWDLIVYMDAENARGLRRILDDDPNGKCVRLLDLTDSRRAEATPCTYLLEGKRPDKNGDVHVVVHDRHRVSALGGGDEDEAQGLVADRRGLVVARGLDCLVLAAVELAEIDHVRLELTVAPPPSNSEDHRNSSRSTICSTDSSGSPSKTIGI